MPTSFDDILAQHQGMLMAYLYSIVRDRHVAEDLVQETFLSAYRHRRRLFEVRSAAAWLRHIALNLGIDLLRRRNLPHAVVYLTDLDEGLFDQLDGRQDVPWLEQLALLRECRERLPEQQRRVLEAFYDQGRSGDEVAAQLGLARRTVHQTLWHARKNLRDCIERRGAQQMRNQE